MQGEDLHNDANKYNESIIFVGKNIVKIDLLFFENEIRIYDNKCTNLWEIDIIIITKVI